MGKLRTLWTLLLLGACVGLAYQGFENTRIPHPVDEQAQTVACDELRACGGSVASWTGIDASPFARIYELDAGSGPVRIECRWSMLMFGEVTCKAEREELPAQVQEKADQRPHEIPRGND